MEAWTIVGALSSIVAAIAAAIAAYLAYPCKVKSIAVGVESIERLSGNCEWEVEFSVANLDQNTVLNDAMVNIGTEGLELLRLVPKSHGGMLMMPDMVLEADSISFSIERAKPRTKTVGTVKIKAEPGLYCLPWFGYGPNLKLKKGNVALDLYDGEAAPNHTGDSSSQRHVSSSLSNDGLKPTKCTGGT